MWQCQWDEFGWEPEAECVVEDAGTAGVNIGEEPAVKLFGSEGRLQVERCRESLATMQGAGSHTAGAEDDGAGKTVVDKGHFADGGVEDGGLGVEDRELDVSQLEADEFLGDFLLAFECDEGRKRFDDGVAKFLTDTVSGTGGACGGVGETTGGEDDASRKRKEERGKLF